MLRQKLALAFGSIVLMVSHAFAATLSYPLDLASGWNLMGNSLSTPLDVKTTFGSQSQIVTVWKWNAGTSTWAFYAPSLDANGTLASYAAGKGYSVLSAINPGEGYWINVTAALALGSQTGTGYSLTASGLTAGWSLVATGDSITPAAFSSSVGNVTTLWAWDSSAVSWYFYAPSLAANSTMASYIASKGYKDFAALSLGNGLGFWVNYAVSAVTPDFEGVRLAALTVVESDPGAQGSIALGPADYQSIADKIAAVPGVQAADYVGDTLGTIYVKVAGGGTMMWRHIKNDLAEAATLPTDADFSLMIHPDWNNQWQGAVEAQPPGTVAAQPQSNTYGTHLPLASGNPDPDYAADSQLVCPSEGKIAIVDFLWTEAHTNFPVLYDSQFMVDGVMLYDRVRMMAEAAGFTLDLYRDTAINVGNVSLLKNYKIVIIIGHGGRPGRSSTPRLGHALASIITPEIYDPNKTTESGMSYEKAWKDGYITYALTDKTIAWTSWFLRDFYTPAPEQLVMSNQCWGMLPFNVGVYPDGNHQYVWEQDTSGAVYNLGDGFMAAGVKVVTGYITPATPEAVVTNTMDFLRRLFGGYSHADLPPWPHTYWPTCMSAQTFFRLPATPQLAIYAPKFIPPESIFTMYAVPQAKYFREVCNQNPNRHAYMQSFMLNVGTPATALPLCWDTYWSAGTYPSGIVDPLCSQGDNPTTQAATADAACAVKESRQVTNAILKVP